MKYLIIGLGNPGTKYENTRHNIGFKVCDALAKMDDVGFSTERHADMAAIKHKGRTLILVKPNTFMNLSGKAVQYWMQHEKISIENILVIVDDIALPFGKIRLKGKGSDGGHNGLKSIQATLNGSNYARLRFGVGSDFRPGQQADYVLSDWNKDESLDLPARIEAATACVLDFVCIGLGMTMTKHNGL